ncbi:hypothetical protein [Solwaraspora sp. WMMD792]|uniref:hypothetical protein n=1 Tax=Solwaraspora sp. WMMD792 TaxID=3016099 RepID=UPI002417CA15|nr:hypothetical protein [Solwaraspora sp. WMMD792]MDG4773789.1 hypothetical protein [Solwaraspora sp. WMMD792]
MSATVDPPPPRTDPSTPRQKISWVDRLIQAAAIAGSIAGVASFFTEHPTAGLRLIAGSLLVGGVALAFRWRTAGGPRFGFTGALALALVGAGVFGWSVRPGATPDVAAPDVAAPAPGPTGSSSSGSSPTTAGPDPAPDGTSVTVHRAETVVPLSARTEIDLDSLAPDWDVAGYDETGRADLRFSTVGLEAINNAELRKAAGDGPELCQQATAQYQLTLDEDLPETRYTCAITNEDRFASVRFNREDVRMGYTVFSSINLTITVYNRAA